jgi:hypothetical protein
MATVEHQTIATASELHEDHASEHDADTHAGTTVLAAQQTTAASVDAVAENTRQKPLPPEVRRRVEELFGLLNASRATVPAGSNWTKSVDDRAHMVELGALLYEYSNVIPELTARTDGALSAVAIRKSLQNVSSVSDVEQRVIELLRQECSTLPIAEEKGRRSFSEPQKKAVVALMRLLRKRDLSTDSMNDFLKQHNLSPAMISTNWVPLFEKEGIPMATVDIIPEIYTRVCADLGKGKEKPAVDDAQSRADQTSATEPASPSVPGAPPEGAPDAPSNTAMVADDERPSSASTGLLPADHRLMERIVEQNGPLAQFLLEAQEGDIRREAVQNLLALNAVLMQRLLARGGLPIETYAAPSAQAMHAAPSNGEKLPHDTVNVNGHRVEVPKGARVTFVIEQTRFDIEQKAAQPSDIAHAS